MTLLLTEKGIKMIILIILVILAYLGIGTFALLNWQATPIVWAQPIVFILGGLSFILVGVSITALIIAIKESKN